MNILYEKKRSKKQRIFKHPATTIVYILSIPIADTGVRASMCVACGIRIAKTLG